jgi:hypothetical protein
VSVGCRGVAPWRRREGLRLRMMVVAWCVVESGFVVCERVLVVIVVEEEWLKSSSAAENTTGLGCRRSCTRPKRFALLPFGAIGALKSCLGKRDSAGMQISPCTQRRNMQS